MPRPQNGIYIIQGEVSLVVTAMRRTSRWTSHNHQDDDQDPLISNFSRLRDILNSISDLDDIAPNDFLSPFLEVIRSEDTTGPITGLALTSVNKFLTYGLVDPGCETAAAAIENIADAVTHARFVGTDPGSDEVVLMKILHVLRTLLLIAAGALLTNESVCEIMQSCFRICFEMRLSELLRRSAEHTLMDMVQLLFSRLPQFKEDTKWAINMKKLKMRAGSIDPSRSGKKKKGAKSRHKKSSQQSTSSAQPSPSHTQPTDTQTSTDTNTTQLQQQQQLQEQQQQLQQEQEQQAVAGDETVPNETSASTEGTQQQEEDSNKQMAAEGSTVHSTDTDAGSMAAVEEMLDRPETIATTPVAPTHLRTMVDIHDSFRDASDREDGEKGSEEGGQTTGQTNEDVEGTSDSTYLSVPGETLRAATSETELNVDADKCSFTSETGEDQESLQSHADVSVHQEEYVNPRGVRFTSSQHHKEGSGPLIPYGLPCVRELFRFLISLTNPLDRHNTDMMVHMGLSLLTVALEAGADHISSFNSLLMLVKDDMCRNLFFLLQSERLSLYAASLRVCFLLFESMRSHLKFQLESYLIKLMDIIVSESPRVSYEQREIALESVVQMIRIPGLVTELYLNYDCDLYCTNLFDDLMKLLSKNAFPVAGLFSTHLLSLDALLAVIDSIEQQCHHRILTKAAGSDNRTDEDKQADEMKGGDMDSSTEMLTMTAPPQSSQTSTGPPHTGVASTEKTKPDTDSGEGGNRDSKRFPNIRPNRMQISANIPTVEELAIIKRKKRVYQTGTEYFNSKPSKGIAYLQEQGLLSAPLDPVEVVTYIKENPKLDKKQIGEFVSSKKNNVVLQAFMKSFNFEDIRVDEALRMFLETFRLPGEAPVISYILEHFAEHWHKSNGEPFANADAAFTLAYAVIMLNVDQHNHNAKKQNIPMTLQEFRRNVKGVNGGKDFDEDMLEELFQAIRNEEIVMPAEQHGLVRENYMWKILLRRGQGKEGVFIHAPTGTFDHDLFALVWGPTVAALSFVFDKSLDEIIIQKAISGFRKCAMISAHYGMSDVFDNLVISLCKFTTLLSTAESSENIPIVFGNNVKAQLAARTVFGLAHRHGDILREGWKNILDCMLQLFRANLLPELLVKVEDFVDPNGRISLVKEEMTSSQRSESGVLSSFYSYFSLTDTPQQRGPSIEEQESIKQAHGCIQECHLEQLVTESKFLRMESLHELIKALVFASRCPDQHEHDSMGNSTCDEDSAVFYLELLIRVVLQNRDRVGPFWQTVRDHIYNLIVNATEHTFLVERAVVGLLRLAIRLLRREEVASQVLTSLQIILMMKPTVIHSVCRQLSYGLHDLLRTNAANIHSSHDWFTLFTLLEVVGAGSNPPPLMQVGAGVNIQESLSDAGAQSDSELSSGVHSDGGDRGYTSDSEIYNTQDKHHRSSVELDVQPMQRNGSWLLVNKQQKEDADNGIKKNQPVNQYNIVLNEELQHYDSKALMKSCETLAFLVRDAAHVTPHNFESCVHAIRTFVEASLHGGRPAAQKQASPVHGKESRRSSYKLKRKEAKMKKSRSSPSHLHHSAHHSDEEAENDGYHSMSIQLLDLMHTLHTRAATIFSSWAEEECSHSEQGIDAGAGALWIKCWCPLLQGIARLCCDARRQVRSQALTYLQRALLVHDLQTLSAVEWESCFNKVLFPLLSKLLDPISPHDPNGVEETRMRASTLLCKVFLQHLSPLLSLPTFTALWLTILEFMDKYMHADKSDLLCEAIPESLKNMLLVMHTAGILQSTEADASQLWRLTWDRIETFLPELKHEVFKPHESHPKRLGVEAQSTEQAPAHPSAHNGQVEVAPSPPAGPSPCHSDVESEQSPSHVETAKQVTPVPPPAPAAPVITAAPVAPVAAPTAPLPPPPPPLSVNSPLPPPATGVVPSEHPPGESALTAGFPGAGTYILHPPLPSLTPGKDTPLPVPAPLPILLNPNLVPQVGMPVITTQSSPERKTEVVSSEGQ